MSLALSSLTLSELSAELLNQLETLPIDFVQSDIVFVECSFVDLYKVAEKVKPFEKCNNLEISTKVKAIGIYQAVNVLDCQKLITTVIN
jgi:hypothetical protein